MPQKCSLAQSTRTGLGLEEKSDLKRHFFLTRSGKVMGVSSASLRVKDHLTILQGHTKQGCQNIQDDNLGVGSRMLKSESKRK